MMLKRLAVLVLIVLMADQFTMASDSLLLWYKQPAQKWTDALPIGNGRLGAMIYGGIQEEHIQFNEETIWTGGPRQYQRNDAYIYLDSIRQLLFAGKQKEAEQMAEEHFMGLKDIDISTYEKTKQVWFDAQRRDTILANENFIDIDWPLMQLPTLNGWETTGMEGVDGVVWFRKSFELPADWKPADMQLNLGRIRDEDFTYINGQLLGHEKGISTKRNYRVPAAVLKPGLNVIAVQVFNYFDKGGFTGIKSGNDLFTITAMPGGDGLRVELGNNWRYHIQNTDAPPFPQYEASYQPFGDLHFKFLHNGIVSQYKRSLDLSAAVASVAYNAAATGFTREYIASSPAQTIAFKYTASKAGTLNLDGSFSCPHAIRKTKRISKNILALYAQPKNGVIKAVAYLYVKNNGGILEVTDDKVSLRGATSLTCYLVAATNFVSYKDVSADAEMRCQKYLQQVSTKSFDSVKLAHVKDYQSYFNRFAIQLGEASKSNLPTDERIKQYTDLSDAGLVALYVQYARYLLLSSSRPNTQPANLQGIWNDELTPPWGSKYTTNINLQMNYWAAEPLNLSECAMPLFDMIRELAEAGAATAKAHYNAPGWVLHHNTDLWRGTAPINASNHGVWVSGSGWLAQHIWEHYQFTGDEKFLRQYYPYMASAARFYYSFLVRDPSTRYYISTPSNSPEQGGLVAGPTMDHQIIRQLFEKCIQAASILHVDAALTDSLSTRVKEIAPNKVGRFGQLQEWMTDIDDTSNTHRHVSHLWGVYPGTDITWSKPDLMKAALQSLHYRGNGGTGWSLAWKLNLLARFKQPEAALGIIGSLLSPAETATGAEQGGVYKNLFDAHPPFQIDGNFGGATGVAEMLLQSEEGYIELLPALPVEWRSGMVNGLCARTGFVVDIVWKDGKLQSVKVVSRLGKSLELRYAGKLFKANTKAGEVVILDGSLLRK